MKILHVITTINRGGAENHLVSLVEGQLAEGLDVDIAYLKGDGYWTEHLRGKGARIHPLGLSHYGEPAPLRRLTALLNGAAPDIVHAHMPPAECYAAAGIALSRGRPPLVISKHNDEPFCRLPGSAWLGRAVGKRATRIIAISDAVNNYTRRRQRVSDERIVTVRYGIDPAPYREVSAEARAAVRKEWGIPPEAWVLGTVARLVPQKALHILLGAYADYLRIATADSRLVLVGRGPQEAELKALAERLGISARVIWAGFREDIPQVMTAFDVFALTSSYEGFGLVLLEAMSARRPIVASRISAIPEIVVDQQTGLLCPAGDRPAFAQAFLRCEDAATRAAFGEAGYERALQEFSVPRMVERTLALYRDCLRDEPRR